MSYADKEKKIKWWKEYKAKNKEKLREYNRSWTKKVRDTDLRKHLINNAKSRIKRYGNEVALSVEDILVPEQCPILGIKFDNESRAFKPSLDRIDNSKGYIKGNVQVISFRANMMKNDASKEELISFAKWVLKEYADER